MSIDTQRRRAGSLLAEIVETARRCGPVIRVGLMNSGSELGKDEILRGARIAMERDPRIQVVLFGPDRPDTDEGRLEWFETGSRETDIAASMEKALDSGFIMGAVALHYPFPVGVTTIGCTVTPGRGHPLFIASTTGTSSTCRIEAMVRNTIYGTALARAIGNQKPSIGILNVDGASSVLRILEKLADNGYPITFGSSIRTDGGALLRGNDLLAGSVDVCVCDTLTGNVLMKLFSAFTTGGSYESQGWGYGPSLGEGWDRVVSIISRASGAPVIANALILNSVAVRGRVSSIVATELAAARKAGLDELLNSLISKGATSGSTSEVVKPVAVPVDDTISGLDVLDLDSAVHELWKNGIYAEAAMGCTGPVIRLPAMFHEQSERILVEAGYL